MFVIYLEYRRWAIRGLKHASEREGSNDGILLFRWLKASADEGPVLFFSPISFPLAGFICQMPDPS